MTDSFYNRMRLIPLVFFFVAGLVNLPALSDTQESQDIVSDNISQPQFNHLRGEQSVYLQSHATDPVEWYPWGEEAFAIARADNKPIFLSIGYASCHWCHVMQRETFEDSAMASILNEKYICVLVDREERPDLDHIYMGFAGVIAKTGGWPMTIFMTPDLKPFFAGGFFAPEPRYGKPGLKKLAIEIFRQYRRNRSMIDMRTRQFFDQLSKSLNAKSRALPLAEEIISRETGTIAAGFDPLYGGFGQRAKFPRPVHLALLLSQFSLTKDSSYLRVVTKTLDAMAQGGIFDQLGGGFHRYTVDRRWRVPHFEKMLYDNALMVPVYCNAFRITKDSVYLKTVTQTLDFIIRELRDNNGGFYASIDSDSDEEEGKFYTFSSDEIVAPENVRTFIRDYYDIAPDGEIGDRNVLFVSDLADSLRHQYSSREFESILSSSREILLRIRTTRSKPRVDRNILTSWNGLALKALCDGYQVTGDMRYLDAAKENARLILSRLTAEGHLLHLVRSNKTEQGLFLEDYAYYISGLIELFQTDTSSEHFEWLNLSEQLATDALSVFGDETGKLFLREKGQSDLVMRPLNEADGSVPAPGSIFIEDLLKLYRITGDVTFAGSADKFLKGISGRINRSTSSMTSALYTLQYYLSDKIEILVVGTGPELQRMIKEIQNRYIPGLSLIISESANEDLPVFEGRRNPAQRVTAYVCRNSQCKLPVQTTDDLIRQLDDL